MKHKFWILLCIVGGILMIVGSATGSAYFYQYLFNLALPYIGPEFIPFVSAILKVLEYIAYFGGYSVLVGVFLILINQIRLGKIIIMIATSFGIFGLIIFATIWIVGALNITLDPMWQTILNQIYSLFTFNSGMAFGGTVLAVVGKYGIKKPGKEVLVAEEESSSRSQDSKFCPQCGATLPARANFCNKCGKNFD
jgi:ribosomal protein L40E